MNRLKRAATTDTVRVRFAPSPSGFLHVGGARTALFNWLFARHHGGKFILRVEDTDAKRSSIESIQAIIESMRWLGLEWDEGPDKGGPVGPYFQSGRHEDYQAVARQLVESGYAYPCYCTEEELDLVRKEQQKTEQPIRYNGRCRELTREQRESLEREGRPAALRFKMSCERVTVPDIIKGPVEFDAALYGDQVILRSSGQAMYNFACVVDDTRMGITHVIRGDEHLANTPKQILLYRALGIEPPLFGHIPMILGKDREKLSKRHGHTSVGEYSKTGYLPDAMVNYLGLLGWSSGTDDEVFTREELIRRFTLEGVAKNPAIFDGTKLGWLNQQHIKKKTPEELAELLQPFLEASFGRAIPRDDLDRSWLIETVRFVADFLVVLSDVGTRLKILYEPQVEVEEEALSVLKASPRGAELLSRLRKDIETTPWSQDALKGLFHQLGQDFSLKGKHLFHPLRAGTTGRLQGADLLTTVRLLGRERVMTNIDRIRAMIGSTGGD